MCFAFSACVPLQNLEVDNLPGQTKDGNKALHRTMHLMKWFMTSTQPCRQPNFGSRVWVVFEFLDLRGS